jgi:uncharacterized protein GlcG (DUF336 family)
MRTITTLDSDEAWRLVNLVVEFAASDGGRPVVVSVYGADGLHLAYRYMDHALPASTAVAPAKANTAYRDAMATSGYPPGWQPANWAATNMTSFGGGVPVIAPETGIQVGSVGVSGRSEADDEALAHRAIAALWAVS